MTLTIREALKFGGLFGSVVVAGEAGIDSPVESVSVLEIADSSISHWVEKNQLYITSFYAIWSDVEKQELVIKKLWENGCCGLVLCNVGMLLQQIDQDILDLCDSLGFPLIQARANVSYIEIITPILSSLVSDKTIIPAIDDFSAVRNDILNLIANEENTESILTYLNKQIGKQISYYDIYGNCIFSDVDQSILFKEQQYLKGNFNHVLYSCSTKGYAKLVVGGVERLFVLIRSSKNLFGIFVTDCKELPEDLNRDFLCPIETSCILLFSRQNRIADYQKRAEQEFVSDLLVWNFSTEEIALDRGKKIMLPIDDINRIVLININSPWRIKETKLQKELQEYVQRLLVPQTRNYVKSINHRNWLVLKSDTVIVFLDTRKSNVKTFNIKDFCRYLLNIFTANLDLSISIGVSNEFEKITKIPSAYMQAFQAAVVGRNHYGDNNVTFYDQICFFQKLQELGEKEDTLQTCYRFLQPISAYDEKHGTSLAKTLKCLLYHQGNVQRVANELYIHKNTVLQRRSKILNLLGYSPFEMPHLLNFLMLFNILDSIGVNNEKNK